MFFEALEEFGHGCGLKGPNEYQCSNTNDLLLLFIDQQPPEKLLRRYVLDVRLARVVVRVNGATQPRIPFLRKFLERCSGRDRLPYRALVEEAIERTERELQAAQHEAIIEGRA